MPNRNIWFLDFALCGMYIGIFASIPDDAKTRISVRNAHYLSAVVAVSLFTFDSVVSQSRCSLCATLWLYHGDGFRWSVSIFY